MSQISILLFAIEILKNIIEIFKSYLVHDERPKIQKILSN